MPKTILWKRAAWSVVIAVALNVLVFHFVGPLAAMIEAVPGGIIVGALPQLLWRPKR